jgi:uncharacterized protein
MATPALAQLGSGRYARVAGPVHTIFALMIVGAWTLVGKIMVDQMEPAANPHRIRLYVLGLFAEWFLFAYVIVGVRRTSGSSIVVVGNRWHSVRQVLRDSGIAAAFWIIATILLLIFGLLLRLAAQGRDIRFVVPHGRVELALWIGLSVTAGICEETIFRGYLQRQFMALTGSATGGIILSAAVFGAAHAYQGSRRMILIGLYGAMFGILAHWRGTVRPGMIAHAWQDSLSGVLATLMRH